MVRHHHFLSAPPIDESSYLDLAQWWRHIRAPYLDGSSSRTHPFVLNVPAIGTWRIDDFRGIYGRSITVLTELEPKTLTDSELDSMGKLDYVKRPDATRYEQWIREGVRPPPVEVLETERGQLRVSDGHRRLVASRSAGAKLLCWVSPTVNVPTGALDCNGVPIKTGLTFEMWIRDRETAFSGSPFCTHHIEPMVSEAIALAP